LLRDALGHLELPRKGILIVRILPNFCKLALLAALILAATQSARASTLGINLTTPVNGTAPAGTLAATVTDTGTGQVQLKLDATGLTDTGEYVPTWLLNLLPSWNFSTAPLTFAYVSGIQATGINSGTSIDNGGSQVKAGLFDISFSFQTSNSGTPPVTRLSGGTTSVYDISATGLSAASFAATSAVDGGNPGGYYAAADVRGIPPSLTSGSIAATTATLNSVPEPSPLVLSGTTFTCLALATAARRLIARFRAA
jgi:hypothetical protein